MHMFAGTLSRVSGPLERILRHYSPRETRDETEGRRMQHNQFSGRSNPASPHSSHASPHTYHTGDTSLIFHGAFVVCGTPRTALPC